MLSKSFEVLDQEEFLEVAEHSTITPSAAAGTPRVSAPLGSDRVRQQSVSPLVSKWLKLCCLLSGLTMPAIHTLRRTSPTLEPPSDIGATPVEFIWSDLKSEAYKGALLSKFDEYRKDRYNHLDDEQYAALRKLVSNFSHTLVIDDVEPTVVSGYDFDIELVEGAVPVRHQLPKRSPQEKDRQRYHLQKEEAAGHLRIPTDAQKSEWATRTHIVSKKDDPNGRWICDFRPLNRLTKKRVTALGDVFSKTRSLAAKIWKTGLDAWSGSTR